MPLLELRNVSKGFGNRGHRTQVLHDIRLTVEEGEFVAIVGYSGSGKSTLISILSGLMQPDAGQVLFQGLESCPPGPDRGVRRSPDE